MLAQHVYTDNSDRNLEKLIYNNDGVDSFTSVDDDNRITKVAYALASQSYVYDAYGRIESLTTKHNSTTVLTETLGYQGQSTQVATYTADAANYDKTWTYTYDDNGNILSVSDGVYTTSYQYDSANQLIRENNQAGGFTYVWVYDDAGNIVVREEYPYTTGTVNPADSDDLIQYAYDNDNWGDLLTIYDGKSITYDVIGNPLTYDGWTFTWEHGRELASMAKDGTTWSFTYDANGMRTQRSNGITTYKYIYIGGQLTQLTVGSNKLLLAYDANGTPLAVTYNGTAYYYVTNLQGDVVAILNTSGTAVVTYSYDAWGNLLSTGGSMASTLGQQNPLRYRGYVYDTETELYYLQSRYYNPEWGRFLNADSFVSTGGTLGNNMFAYCGNNPVAFRDPNGHARVGLLNKDFCSTLYDYGLAGSAGGGSIIAIGYGFEVLGGLTDEIEKKIESLMQQIIKKLERSLAHASQKEYRTAFEKHHIAAKAAINAGPAAAILNEVLAKGVEDESNFVMLKTAVHRRIHTGLYYLLVNELVIIAYNQADGNPQQERENVLAVLGSMKIFLESLNNLE